MNEQDVVPQQNGGKSPIIDGLAALLNSPTEGIAAVTSAYRDTLQQGDKQAAEQILEQFAIRVRDQANKEADLQLLKKALQHANNGEWQEAEDVYHQLIALEKTGGNLGKVYFAYENLSNLHGLLGQKERALEVIREATEIARLHDSPRTLHTALAHQAQRWLNMGDGSQALSVVTELMAVPTAELIAGTKAGNPYQAKALVLRAKCYLALKRITYCQQDLDAAWPLLTPQAEHVMLAGVQGRLASWWGVTAELRSLQADFDGTVAARRNAVQHDRYVCQAPQVESPYKEAWLAYSLRSLGEALLVVKDTEAAEAAFAESSSLLKAIHLS